MNKKIQLLFLLMTLTIICLAQTRELYEPLKDIKNLQPKILDCGMLNVPVLDLKAYYEKQSQFNLDIDRLKDRNLDELKNAISIEQVFQKRERGPVRRTISIAAHVFTLDDGTGGISRARIEEAIEDANETFAAYNLTFELCIVDDIKSSTHYNMNNMTTWRNRTTSTDYIINQNIDDDFEVEGMLNIYFHKRIGGLSYSTFPWWQREHILMDVDHMDTDNALNNEIFIHELGHWFGLLHTFETRGGTSVELVARTNCGTAGDQLCDTQADINPNGQAVYNSNSCAWTGNLADSAGTPYRPNTNNLMSYYFNCMNTFTAGQGRIILTTILGGRNDFINVGCTGEKGNCIKFNPNNLSISSQTILGRGTSYELHDGSISLKVFPNMAEANQAKKIIEHYKSNELCTLSYSDFEYLLTDGNAPLNLYEGEDCIGFDPIALEVKQKNGQWCLVENNKGNRFCFGDDERAARDALITITSKGFTKSCFIGRPDASMKYLRKDFFLILPPTIPLSPIIINNQ